MWILEIALPNILTRMSNKRYNTFDRGEIRRCGAGRKENLPEVWDLREVVGYLTVTVL
jgi:hypothetical protein